MGIINNLREWLRGITGYYTLLKIHDLLVDEHLAKLKDDEQISGINRYEQRIYSQGGEDGIIQEIFRRLKIEEGHFVEIGVEDGLECNTAYLLTRGWKGFWYEKDRKSYKKILHNFKDYIGLELTPLNYAVTTGEEYFNKKTQLYERISINEIVSDDLDFLSIDIDSYDHKLLENLKYKPKVICIEYNGFRTDNWWLVEKTSSSPISYGATIKKMIDIGNFQGYKFLGTTLSGINAFFVREDLYSASIHSLACDKNVNPRRVFLYTTADYNKKDFRKGTYRREP